MTRMILVCNLLLIICLGTLQAQEPKPVKAVAYGQVARLEDWVTAVEWSHDGKKLAVGTYEQTLIWDVDSKKVIWKLPAKYGYVRGLMFSDDDQQLYAGCYQTIEIFDLSRGKRINQFKAHGSDITKLLRTHGSSQYLSASKDKYLSLWNIGETKPVKSFKMAEPIYDLSLSNDDKLCAVALGDETRVTLAGQVELINLETGESALTEKLPEQGRYASSVSFTEDQKFLISGSNDTKGYVYQIETIKALGFFGGHKRPINGLDLIPGTHQVISVSGGRTKGKNELRIWDYVTGDDLAFFEPHTESVTCVALSPDGKLVATGGQDKTAIIWKMESILQTKSDTAKNPPADTKEKADSKLPPAPYLPE